MQNYTSFHREGFSQWKLFVFFGFLASFFLNQLLKNNINWLAAFVLIIISIGYVEIKNILRINNDFKNQSINNFPWPYYPKLTLDEDYIIKEFDLIRLNKRIKTNKLIFDNNSDYILMCGNIPFPCVPIKKERCMGEIYKINGYLFVNRNKNNIECSNLINNNILY